MANTPTTSQSRVPAPAIAPLDPEAATPVHYPELPGIFSGGWTRLVRLIGPGAVMASVSVGTGETIFAPRLGAIFGNTLLWTILAAVICKGVLVYTGGRHLVLTGEHPMQAWARLPGPRRWAPFLLGLATFISFPFWIAALTGAVGNLTVWITGWGNNAGWGSAIVITAAALSMVQTYQVVERVSTALLGLKLLLIVVAIVMVQPDLGAILGGTFLPRLPDYEPWVASVAPAVTQHVTLFHVAVFLGVIGGGVQDYLGYVSFIREKNWGLSGRETGAVFALPTDPEQIRRARYWLRFPLLDVVFSFTAVFVLTACFMILGAAVLHPLHEVPTDADLYSKQSQFLGLVSPHLVGVYKAGIFFAIFAAVYGVFEVYTRSLYEPLRAVFPARAWDVATLRRWVTAYCALGAMVLLWTQLKTVGLVEIISPLTGVLGCGLWCLAMVWVDRAQTPRAYRMTPLLLLLTLVVGLAMVALGGYTAIAG